MKRSFRLTRFTDFQRVRRSGKTYAHPLVVLIVAPGESSAVQVGVAAGRVTGNAVERNRAKRRIRACMDGLLPRLTPGWDLILLARKPIHGATFDQLQTALQTLLGRAGLLLQDPPPGEPS
ncbi:MAG TPA: ribonuclease P protein component [Anaerolineaceae bacterium]|nr:ribonuclease P protein component [Longilinea sp.]HOG79944.1 ribonuclease P protein component [Anaerolineaceae bacterium]HQN43477.1 ribonuclease P protein component [Anaerolineaceae bacterium]